MLDRPHKKALTALYNFTKNSYNSVTLLDKICDICYTVIVESDKHLVAVPDSENGFNRSNWLSVSGGENEGYLLFFIMRCSIMYITFSSRDKHFAKSTLLRTVSIPFRSYKSSNFYSLDVNVYRYPCGRLCFCVPCASFCFGSYLNNRCGYVCFQSVVEMIPYTGLPAESLYLMLGVHPYGCKRLSELF